MRKKKIILIVALVLVLVLGGSALTMTVINVIASNKQEEELKKENEKAAITELFHDQGHIYMTPDEPNSGEEVTLRLRTARYNVTSAQIQYTTDEGVSWNAVDMEFEKKDDTGYYDIWKGVIPAEGELIYYRFMAGNEDTINSVYYDTTGVNITEGDCTKGWQIVPGHDVPEWAKGALWYSLMPDSFYNGSTTNDKNVSGENTHVSWSKKHRLLMDRYGGDLQGLESKLDYIESLGVDAIFINPITKSYYNVGYGPINFNEVESALGNEEDLTSLANAIHERDMKLMGDVVLTFASEESYYVDADNYWPTTGALQSEDSEWLSMFKFYDWPDNYMVTWDSPAIDLNTSMSQDFFYANEDSYLLRYADVFDGYRFDCGGWLWGTSETDELEAYPIVKEIREALRSVNDEFFVLAEADWSNLNTGTWDAQWNIDYMPKLQDYAMGLINESLMTASMHEYEMTIPRNVALCMQNMISDHDSTRVVQYKDHMYNAAVLIQMTYLGAPSIFYGEEINNIRENETGVGSTGSYYAMEWDESNWDYDRLNFYKAIAELRQEYSCVKTGVVNVLQTDNENNMISFGRWDENGAIITVTSQNEEVITVELPVKECDIKDGTILTDWFTGAEYVVEDGKIVAEIIPGGTVFVTGEKSSSYRLAYDITAIGKPASKNVVLAKNSSSFAIEGKGSIEGSKDKITFVNTVSYNNFSVFANIKGDDSATLIIRNGLEADDMFYAVVIQDDKLTITARTHNGKKAKTLVETECTSNTYVKLERTGDNKFIAYKAEVKDGNLGTWEKIENSATSISMNNQVYYGFAPLKGEMRVNNLTYTQLEDRITFDTFDGEVNTALFDHVNADFVSVSDGSLTITNSKDSRLHYLLTNSMDYDWTFKTKFSYSPARDEYAGVVSYQDEDNFVVAGRTKADDGQEFFVGKYVNGEMAVYGTVKDPVPNEDVVIQLQRIGGYYSAVYSADEGETWNYIGRLFANLCDERVGILVSGDGKATFDWVSFGDSINDGVSTNTPYSPVEVDTTYVDTSDECTYEWLTGDWSMVTGGWHQENEEVFAQASATNKVFKGLYAEATIEIEEGAGWAGLAFGKSSADSSKKDGFILKYYKSGKLVLTAKNEIIAETKLETTDGNAMRLVINATDGEIIVYAGQEAVPVMAVSDTNYEKGYVALCTDGVKADFRNFHHGSTNASWLWVSSEGGGGGVGLYTKDTSSSERQIHSVATLLGYSFTDFVCTARLNVVKDLEDLDTASGLLLCSSEGRSASVDGAFVYVDGKGSLGLSIDGKEVETYDLPGDATSALIMVVKQNGTYRVFLHGVNEPVLEYSEDFNRGGVLSVYTINGFGGFTKLAIENLQPNQDYTKSNIVVNWKNLAQQGWKDDFAESEAMGNYHLYNEGNTKFIVEDGTLHCYDCDKWGAGATIMNDIYSDFTMQFKVRMLGNTDSWMSIGMRKGRPYETHVEGGFSLMLTQAGDVYFNTSDADVESTTAMRGKIDNFKIGDWYDVKIVAKGESVTAYVNGVKMASYKDTKFGEGFISIVSGMAEYYMDDLKITPIK